MKKQIWLTAGIAGMLLGIPLANAQSEIKVHISRGSRPSFIIDTPPSFIYLRTQGFSVSTGIPYDIVFYGNRYYLFNDGSWYSSLHYRGPWISINNNRLPSKLRRYRWDDIRRYRDIEYRRADSRYNHYQRNDDNMRRTLDQRNDSGYRMKQGPQHEGGESRMNQGPQYQGSESRMNQGSQHEGGESRMNQGPSVPGK